MRFFLFVVFLGAALVALSTGSSVAYSATPDRSMGVFSSKVGAAPSAPPPIARTPKRLPGIKTVSPTAISTHDGREAARGRLVIELTPDVTSAEEQAIHQEARASGVNIIHADIVGNPRLRTRAIEFDSTTISL